MLSDSLATLPGQPRIAFQHRQPGRLVSYEDTALAFKK
jgi:hypothetical protein